MINVRDKILELVEMGLSKDDVILACLKYMSVDGYTCIRYHSTEVVKFNDDEIILNSGGWQTVTTKLRMNQASNQFRLGFYVHQRQHEWFVTNSGRTYSFNDGMILERYKEVNHA